MIQEIYAQVQGGHAYDSRKQLWRVSIHPLIQFNDAKVPWYRANIWHDLNNGSYPLSNLDNEIKARREGGRRPGARAPGRQPHGSRCPCIPLVVLD